VFQALLQGQFYLKRPKCSFAQRRLEYLGHIISKRGVEPDPSKIQAMLAWPTTKSPKDLRAFLGLTGFYHKFIQGYATIAFPLTALLCKNAFAWTAESQSAFEKLKTAMTHAPVLALPNFDCPFVLETDASGTAMGAVLL